MVNATVIPLTCGVVRRSAPASSTVYAPLYAKKGDRILILPDEIESEHQWGVLTEPIEDNIEGDEEHWYYKIVSVEEFLEEIKQNILSRVAIFPDEEWEEVWRKTVEAWEREGKH